MPKAEKIVFNLPEEQRREALRILCIVYDSNSLEESLRESVDMTYSRRFSQIDLENRASGKEESVLDTGKRALETMVGEKEPIYRAFGDTPEEAMENSQRALNQKIDYFLTSREEHIKRAFVDYIAETLTIILSTGRCNGAWHLAKSYGMKEDYEAKTLEEVRYKGKDQLSKKDWEAIQKTAEALYSGAYYTLQLFYSMPVSLVENLEEVTVDRAYRDYRKTGYSLEVLKAHNMEESTTIEDMEERFWYSLQLYAPYVLYHLNKALFFAFKLKGTEYKDYLSSLNAWEDFTEFATLQAGGEDIIKALKK